MQILLGTHNKGKAEEALSILGSIERVEFLTYRDCGFPEIKEDGSSYRENAYKKAKGISEATGLPVLSEDAGLEVDKLDGDPGVFSSRFAGKDAGPEENNRKLTELLGDESANRDARFVSCALLYLPGGEEEEVFVSHGVLEGEIALKPRGKEGFGYDPLFIPDGFSKTLAQLGSKIKDGISHRNEALKKMKEEIRNIVTRD